MLFIENDKKILYSNLESSTRVSSALLEFGVTRRLCSFNFQYCILFTKTSGCIWETRRAE